MLGRRAAGAAYAEPGEVALVCEAGTHRDVADRSGRSGEQVDSFLQAQFSSVASDRRVPMTPERTSQSRRMYVQGGSDVRHRDPLQTVGVQVFDGARQPRRRLIRPSRWLAGPARERNNLQAETLETKRRRGIRLPQLPLDPPRERGHSVYLEA